MNWSRDARLKLARIIRELSLNIQDEEFCRRPAESWPEVVEKTQERIMERLEPLGFKPANQDWTHDEEERTEKGLTLNLYEESPTHLWFETAQCRIVRIRKDHAEKVLVLGLN